MTTHTISMTYHPKIWPVRCGECTQTIRRLTDAKRRWKVGDRLIIHGWEGRPYRSPWSWRVDGYILYLQRIICRSEGVYVRWYSEHTPEGARIIYAHGKRYLFSPWEHPTVQKLARLDYIDPPTGEALRDTLQRLNGPDWEGDYLIIRWKPDNGGD